MQENSIITAVTLILVLSVASAVAGFSESAGDPFKRTRLLQVLQLNPIYLLFKFLGEQV